MPSRAAPTARGELPPPKIAWLHPVQLMRTAYHVWLSSVATEFLDRRETLASLNRTSIPDLAPGQHDGVRPGRFIDAFLDERHFSDDGVWIDYVADVGDSWQATYAVAVMLAEPTLRVRGHEGLIRCSDLVMLGGDLVYPTPTRAGYRERLRSALVAALPQDHARIRHLLAIPGNHDWYDGLTNFVREFCQGGRLGGSGWQLLQRRSYFAVKLTDKWWLWGIDIALDTRIDPPQQSYFLDILRNTTPRPPEEQFSAGDGIILCTAKPAWMEQARYSEESYKNLAFFVKDVIETHHGSVPLILAGDLHHYCRYANATHDQLIVSGGGGSYLMGTHHLPEQVDELRSPPPPPHEPSDSSKAYTGAQFPYPSRTDSRLLALGALRLAFRPANWPFDLLIGCLYLLLMSAIPPQDLTSETLRGLFKAPWQMTLSGPIVVLSIIVLSACVLFAMIANRRALPLLTAAWGLLHAAAHLALALVLAWVTSRRLGEVSPYVLAGCLIVLSGVAGATVIGVYLTVSDRLFGWHRNEVFACQSIIDYRNFLRIHIRRDGSLHIYPIGLRRVPRKWRSRLFPASHLSRHDPHPSRYEPVDDVLDPHLIEGPIHVPAPR